MKKILVLLVVILFVGCIKAQNIDKDEHTPYIVLCDKSEKNMTMYVVDKKYCFLSTKEKDFITLFDPTKIFKITIIAPTQQNEFKKWIEKYCLNYKTQIDAVIYIKLKEGEELPPSLAKYYNKK